MDSGTRLGEVGSQTPRLLRTCLHNLHTIQMSGGNGGTQLILVQAKQRRDGQICSTSNPLKGGGGGTPYQHLPGLFIAFQRLQCWSNPSRVSR